jgi:hypothetical protein
MMVEISKDLNVVVETKGGTAFLVHEQGMHCHHQYSKF